MAVRPIRTAFSDCANDMDCFPTPACHQFEAAERERQGRRRAGISTRA